MFIVVVQWTSGGKKEYRAEQKPTFVGEAKEDVIFIKLAGGEETGGILVPMRNVTSVDIRPSRLITAKSLR